MSSTEPSPNPCSAPVSPSYPRHRRERHLRANNSLGRSASVMSSLLILGPKISWSLQLPGRIFDKEILIDDFSGDRLQVGPSLLHAILRHPFRQIVQMRLQHEPVNRVEGILLELCQQVLFNLDLLHLRRLRSPVPSRRGNSGCEQTIRR
jgi:hypothetical protein